MNRVGIVYKIETILDGLVVDTELVHNLMPIEGLNHMLGVTLASQISFGSWYIGLYRGNYTPQPTDVMATFPTTATEATQYSESNRVLFQNGLVASGACDNVGNEAVFTAASVFTAYGGFMSSSQAKSSTSGILLSAVRFTSPKQLDLGAVLRVTAGFTLASV